MLLFTLSVCSVLLMFGIVSQALKSFEKERESWRIERKELMDRVQAPSFAEYKQGEVRVIKAQQKKEEAPVINYSHLE